MDVKNKNIEDKTAWDISREDNREIRDMLRRAGAKPGSSLSTSNRYPNPKYQRRALPLVDDFLYRKLRREIRNFTVSKSNTTLACVHKEGTAIALEDRLFQLFLICNITLFSISNSLILLLTLKFYIKALFFALTVSLYLSYFYSVWTITDDRNMTIQSMIDAGLYFVAIQLVSPCNTAF